MSDTFDSHELTRINHNLVARIRELETELTTLIVLTPEEALQAAAALRAHAAVVGLINHPSADVMRALAVRLEAAL